MGRAASPFAAAMASTADRQMRPRQVNRKLYATGLDLIHEC